MTRITIKDLPDNIDLDRQAMQAISGGARRSSGRPGWSGMTPLRSQRIIDYPPGFRVAASLGPAGCKPQK